MPIRRVSHRDNPTHQPSSTKARLPLAAVGSKVLRECLDFITLALLLCRRVILGVQGGLTVGANEQFQANLNVVERFRNQRDYLNANGRLVAAVAQYLEERYPYRVTPDIHGITVSYNGYELAVLGAVVHDVIRDRKFLEDIQRTEIREVISKLNKSPASLRLLIVRNRAIKAAILHDLNENLSGVEVWTTDELMRFDLPIRG